MRRLTISTLALALAVGATTLTAQPPRNAPDRGAPDRGAPDRAQAGRNASDRAQMRRALRDRAQPRRGAPNGAGKARGVMGRSAAETLLRQNARLALTDEQRGRLQALVRTQRTEARPSPANQLRLRADLIDAMAEDANPATVRAALDKLSAAENDRIIASLRARQAAMAVLTPEQREKAQAERRRPAR